MLNPFGHSEIVITQFAVRFRKESSYFTISYSSSIPNFIASPTKQTYKCYLTCRNVYLALINWFIMAYTSKLYISRAHYIHSVMLMCGFEKTTSERENEKPAECVAKKRNS